MIRHCRHLAVVALLLAAVPIQAQDACVAGDDYCIRLEPASRVYGAMGSVRLLRPAGSPFTVAVDRDGRHRYETEFALQGLPAPSELGDYAVYRAWVVDPDLNRLQPLGIVRNGTVRTGVVARNKYMLWVTAEPDTLTAERRGPLVMRGLSPSTRMEAHGFMGLSAFMPAEPGAGPWTPPPMVAGVRMMPGMNRTRPTVSPWLPELAGPEAEVRKEVRLADGDTLRLEASPVTRVVHGRAVPGFAYNGQIPGPLIRVDRGTEIIVIVTNRTPSETAVHWHGLRLENAFDGVPGLTQDPIPPGGTFTYRLRFPDAGLYWYHPHHREDVWQDLGLFGNIRVDADWLPPSDHEAVFMLDDVLLGRDGGLLPFGDEEANFALMGRFGNRLLVNGEPRHDLSAPAGSTLRLFLTNVSNTRTFNWSIDGHAVRVVATDVGPFAEPAWTESVVIAPAERYVVDVMPEAPGRFAITNRVQSIDHGRGRFFSTVDTLGVLQVGAAQPGTLRRHGPTPAADVPGLLEADLLAGLPELELELRLETAGLPAIVRQMMLLDQSYFNPVEWTGTMPHMNWVSSAREVRWVLRDPQAGEENMDVSWRFRAGDLVRVRLFNDPDSPHAMQHPIHIHGQRFVVLSVNGEPNTHRAWKDTVLVPVGAEVEILLELSNPGAWMVHCHIAEHLSSGMRMVFEVDQ
ncbi:MAG: multicopper oxidase family protein [Rhodothermales bacterium]|nr:multicopper oxidase family protein [Rhodothermales bacterium]MBO6778307.1 multicopper oxidase family protein [Rhodothermales bacterium]